MEEIHHDTENVKSAQWSMTEKRGVAKKAVAKRIATLSEENAAKVAD